MNKPTGYLNGKIEDLEKRVRTLESLHAFSTIRDINDPPELFLMTLIVRDNDDKQIMLAHSLYCPSSMRWDWQCKCHNGFNNYECTVRFAELESVEGRVATYRLNTSHEPACKGCRAKGIFQ